jgi:hypothetical protein
MAVIQFTAKDLLRDKIVEPAMYKVHIDDVSNGESSKDGRSINYVAEATIIKNADNGSEEFAGVPITWNFNSKAIGFMKGLFEALGETVTEASRFDTNALAGHNVEVQILNDTYNNKLQNKVQHNYRKCRD